MAALPLPCCSPPRVRSQPSSAATCLLHPRARVLTLIFVPFFVTIIELPAALLLGLWFWQPRSPFGVSGLEHYLGPGAAAYLAHVGGFAFGLILIRLFAKDHRRRSSAPPAAGGVLIG